MFPHDIFLRLPRPTALLLLSSTVHLTSAHLPCETSSTAPSRRLQAVAVPPPLPEPTLPPVDPQPLNTILNTILNRREANTICGYVGGDPSLPATCSLGSHCVLDIARGAVGCCPNGEDTCTTGVYTACVDGNSDPQTEDANPYVFTCTGIDVCYKNTFEGGYSQFGCGTASDLAANVAASATGIASGVSLTIVSISYSASTGTTQTTKPSLSSSASPLTTLVLQSPTATTTAPSSSYSSMRSPINTLAPAASDSGGALNRTGAIVGGTVAGVAALAVLLAAAICWWRRRGAGNSRQGPGPRPGDTQYIRPGAGGRFALIGQDSGSPDGSGGQAGSVRGKMITHITGEPYSRNTVFDTNGVGEHNYPAQNLAATWAAAPAATPHQAAYASPQDSGGEDEIPLRPGTPEIDDFSRRFHDALSRIGEEDEDALNQDVNGKRISGTHGSGSIDLSESKPLWVQTQRQSRNLVWS